MSSSHFATINPATDEQIEEFAYMGVNRILAPQKGCEAFRARSFARGACKAKGEQLMEQIAVANIQRFTLRLPYRFRPTLTYDWL